MADASAERVALVQDAIVTYGTVVYFVRPDRRGEQGRPPLADHASAGYACLRGGTLRRQEWEITPAAGGLWHHRLAFIWQDQTARQETVLHLSAPVQGARMRTMAPAANDCHFLWLLGAGTPSGQPLLETLRGTRTAADDRLRGRDCTVVRAGTEELWLAPDLDYAPLRTVNRPVGGPQSLEVGDWWAYRDAGECQLPRYYAFRGYALDDKGELYCRTLALTYFDVAAVGPAAVAQLAPPDWQVPMVVGALVSGGWRDEAARPLAFGIDPVQLWRYAEADGKQLGISISALLADVDVRLPEEPEGPPAGPGQDR